MNDEEKDLLDALDAISPNLKLSGKHLVPVLRRVKQGQPMREDVQKAVMKEFPDKSAKSVFRGMVMPTTTRLKFVRSVARQGTAFLSPNGMGVVEDESRAVPAVRRCLRDYATLEIGLRSEHIDWLVDYGDELKEHDERLHAKANRFHKQFLDHFDVELPSESGVSEGDTLALYQDDELSEFLTDSEKREGLIRTSLPPNQMVQMDKGRWSIIRQLMAQGYLTSTWFVDALLWREWRSEKPAIDLWEASTTSDTKLMHSGTAYDAVIVRGEPE